MSIATKPSSPRNVGAAAEYGVPAGLVFGVPVICRDGGYDVVKGIDIDDFARAKIDVSINELMEERDAVKAILGI